ncbi:HIT domain-containing protein [Candidatus Gracilibacteria bacterium]|nr:HIT domain-containing protein [Candidatus Gracilibacteria bacterium]
MNYHEALKKIGNKCPFCAIDENIKIYDYASVYMTIARAPYGPDHLLIIPKRHVDSLFDLTIEEDDEIQGLVRAGIKMLKKLGYSDLSILVREGMATGKSIPHLHYHIIPNINIGSANSNGEREFLDDNKAKEAIDRILKVKI